MRRAESIEEETPGGTVRRVIETLPNPFKKGGPPFQSGIVKKDGENPFSEVPGTTTFVQGSVGQKVFGEDKKRSPRSRSKTFL